LRMATMGCSDSGMSASTTAEKTDLRQPSSVASSMSLGGTTAEIRRTASSSRGFVGARPWKQLGLALTEAATLSLLHLVCACWTLKWRERTEVKPQAGHSPIVGGSLVALVSSLAVHQPQNPCVRQPNIPKAELSTQVSRRLPHQKRKSSRATRTGVVVTSCGHFCSHFHSRD